MRSTLPWVISPSTNVSTGLSSVTLYTTTSESTVTIHRSRRVGRPCVLGVTIFVERGTSILSEPVYFCINFLPLLHDFLRSKVSPGREVLPLRGIHSLSPSSWEELLV